MIELPIQRLDTDLPMPSLAHDGDAGIDLRARVSVRLSSVTGPVAVPTGIAVSVPANYVGLVCSRSGLAARNGIAVLNAPGIIDPGFRGEIEVVLFSVREVAQAIERGDRIAQLLVVPHGAPSLRAVDSLPASARGERGIGSSGV